MFSALPFFLALCTLLDWLWKFHVIAFGILGVNQDSELRKAQRVAAFWEGRAGNSLLKGIGFTCLGVDPLGGDLIAPRAGRGGAGEQSLVIGSLLWRCIIQDV